MKNIKYIAIALLALTSIVLLTYTATFYYDKYQEEEAFELTQIKVLSSKLEERKSFLNIILGANINSYTDFRLLRTTTGYDKNSNQEVWGYFGNETKYSKVGGFAILNNKEYLELNNSELNIAQLNKLAKYALYVYTYQKKIYKIKATILEYNKNFNEVLLHTYGPSYQDNGYNRVDYISSDNTIKWKSKSITLSSTLEVNPQYFENKDGRLELSSIFEQKRQLEYLYEPIQNSINTDKEHSEAGELQNASDDL